MRYFNIAGPCYKAKHYTIEASLRLHGVESLIDREQYFVIHAARQSGKTTFLKDLTERLNVSRKYYALYCSLENMQGITESKEAIPEIVKMIKTELDFFNIPVKDNFAKDADYGDYTN
jgi:AAA+ ATPase superfamily predicted ATPase